MDMKQLLVRLRPSVRLKVKVRETWTVKVEDDKMIWEQKNIRKK